MSLQVVSTGQPIDTGAKVLLSQVRLEQQLNEAGALGTSWLSYPSLKSDIRPALSHWLMARVQPTLEYDQKATKAAIAAARSGVANAIESYLEGDTLIRPGERLDQKKLQLLLDEYTHVEKQIPAQNRLARVGIILVLLIALAGLNGFYIINNEPRLFENLNHLMVYLTAIVLTALSAYWLSFDPLRMEMIPILFTAILLSIAYNQVLATLTSFSLCLLLTLSATGRFDQFIVLLSTCALTIIPLDRVATRLDSCRRSAGPGGCLPEHSLPDSQCQRGLVLFDRLCPGRRLFTLRGIGLWDCDRLEPSRTG
jgi:membrane-associated HD superfamily phosphohydrolase